MQHLPRNDFALPEDVATPALTVRQVLHTAAALTHAGFCSASEVSKLVSEVHATVVQTTLPFAKSSAEKLHRQAPLPYQLVTGSLIQSAKLLGKMSSQPSDVRNVYWRRFRAVINGVAGDKLAYWNNALAIPMQFVDSLGNPVGIDVINKQRASGLVLFLHGLVCSEFDWQQPEHHAFVAHLQAQGKQVLWLRYNSGLHIHQNGERLAELLQYLDLADKPLTLIGHSMGGLLMRSAYITAQTHKYDWLNQLTHAAYIGSPHHGAQLERSGNMLNSFVGTLPYIKPFMRLGNIRSNGIRDLRYGYVTRENAFKGLADHRDARKGAPYLPSADNGTGTKHLLIATSLSKNTRKNFIGDSLVSVDSALGEHKNQRLTLKADNIQRVHISELGHMAQLRDARVYNALRVFVGKGV